MKEIFKKIKVIILILLVVLISVIAFLGVFKKEKGVWKNVIPEYEYGMDVEGARELRYILDETEEEKYVYVDENGNIMGEVWKDGSAITEEDETSDESEDATGEETEVDTDEIPYSKETRTIKTNPTEELTESNFELAKNIIQKRLKSQDIAGYDIRIDNVTGRLEIDIDNNNDEIEQIEDLIGQAGKFQIIDYQTGIVLMDNSDLNNVSAVYSSSSGYSTYLQFEFNKEGSEKLKNISNEYVETPAETQTDETENTETTETTETTEEETTKKYVSIVFDDTTMMTTYFGEEMSSGILQISVGDATEDYEEFIDNYNSAKVIADIVNSGVLPVTYELDSDTFVKSNFDMNIVKVIVLAIAIIASIIFIIKYRKNGLIASILGAGYIALFIITTKYTNVTVTINSLIVAVISIIINYVFMKILLQNLKNVDMPQAYYNTMKKFYLYLIPVIVVAVVFTLTSATIINSIGMVLFWGICLNALYNLIFTRTIFVNIKNK